MIALLVAALLSAPTRSPTVKAAFVRANPPPAWCATYVLRDGILQFYSRTGACDVDHVCPLKCGGADRVENLQWLDAKANRSKGADCRACEVRR